jgi:hypothetical protein
VTDALGPAALTFLHDPGSVIVKMSCEHGTFSATLLIDELDPEPIARFAAGVGQGHRRDFGCDCTIGVLVNGEDPVQ